MGFRADTFYFGDLDPEGDANNKMMRALQRFISLLQEPHDIPKTSPNAPKALNNEVSGLKDLQ